jgi:cytochrome c biogenesis protein CcmG/thiol:disulfide interchange protein DsbE
VSRPGRRFETFRESIKRHPSSLEPGERGPRRGIVLALLVGAVIALTFLLAFGLSRDPTRIGSPLVGRPAPDFALQTLDRSRTIRLGDFRGQAVVVNFWASWCADCRVEHPALAAAWDRYRDKGVVLLGISYQDSAAGARAYLRELGGDWPSLRDPGSQTALDYGVYGVPETFFIDRSGKIAAKRIGPVTYDQLTRRIDAMLGSTS